MPQLHEHNNLESIVRTHAGWIYTCARKRVTDDATARDITQAVFILYWQKHASFSSDVKLTAWLYQATRYCAANALRLQRTRQHHEKEAAMARQNTQTPSDPPSTDLSSALEHAVDRLKETYRLPILLRFYRQMSLAEVGQHLGISEDAAQKRVERALDQLRNLLGRAGIGTEATSLGVLLATRGTDCLPAGMADQIVTAASASQAAASAATIAKGALKVMFWTKAKLVAIAATTLLTTAGGITILAQTSARPAAPAAPPPTSATPEWRQQMTSTYALSDNEVVKRIAPPHIPARIPYWRYEDGRSPTDTMRPPDQMTLEWDGKLQRRGMGWGPGLDRLGSTVATVMSWRVGDYEGPPDLLNRSLPGDWVIRMGATEQEKLAGLLTILHRDVDPTITIQQQSLQREVIVVRGKFEYHPHLDASRANQILFYSDPYVANPNGGGGTGPLPFLCSLLADCTGMKVIDEVEGDQPERVSIHILASSWLGQSPPDPKRSEKLDSLLRNIAAQTNLSLLREQRTIPVWVISRQK